MKPAERTFVALDTRDLNRARELARVLAGRVGGFKIGLEAFVAFGPSLIEEMRGLGHVVFLDLKFHDIPNTVSHAVSAAAKMGVDMVNVHASGGRAMMEAAVEAAKSGTKRGAKPPMVIGVTVLTSMDAAAMKEVLNRDDEYLPLHHVRHLALLAKESGMDGVVCSALEIDINRKACGKDFALIVPGIRPAGSDVNDQKRIMTPADAARKGADFIVVGRPVTGAENPAAAAKAIVDEMKKA